VLAREDQPLADLIKMRYFGGMEARAEVLDPGLAAPKLDR
jgi:hypothetical protein